MNKLVLHLIVLSVVSTPIYSSFKNYVHRKKIQKPYVIGDLLGQFGNQLFEVATTCAVAWDNDAEPYFPGFDPNSTDYQRIFFRCKIVPPSREISCEYEIPTFEYSPIVFQPKMKIMGYCQNEKYFAHHRDRLVQLFAPHPEDLIYIQQKYGWIINHPNAVSVHVRYYGIDSLHLQYDREYYEKAMDLFPESSLFVVTSDNLEFALQNIPTEEKNVIFIQDERFYIDFYLQSMCKHNIICNSSFSWWSAWLNQNPDKIVVRPWVWFGGNLLFQDDSVRPRVWFGGNLLIQGDIEGPEEWIKIDADGIQNRLEDPPELRISRKTDKNLFGFPYDRSRFLRILDAAMGR
jgi:hypothetical protein